MQRVNSRLSSYFLEPGQMVVDPWYSKDYQSDIDGYFDLWRYYDEKKIDTIEVWLGYKRKPQVKRDRGVFFNEGKYGHALEIINLFITDVEDEKWQDEYAGYEWVKVGRWDNR